jgi:hypothetical protein
MPPPPDLKMLLLSTPSSSSSPALESLRWVVSVASGGALHRVKPLAGGGDHDVDGTMGAPSGQC